jgi:hypothetical protein
MNRDDLVGDGCPSTTRRRQAAVYVPLRQLRRVRWAVRVTLTLGVSASVAANILHAQPSLIAQVIAAWPPLALLLTVELISRVPVDRRLLAAARLVATTGIAGIAAYVSYFHMAGVVSRYGERGPNPYLLPLSVDGLVIVASVSLVELAGRIRLAEDTTAARRVLDARADTTGSSSTLATVPAGNGREQPETEPDRSVPPVPVPAASEATTGNVTQHSADDERTTGQPPEMRREHVEQRDDEPAGEPADVLPPVVSGSHVCDAHSTDAAVDRPPTDTAQAVAYWRNKDPTLRVADIAAKVGRSPRQVRRILADLADTDPATSDQPVNGASADHLVDSITRTIASSKRYPLRGPRTATGHERPRSGQACWDGACCACYAGPGRSRLAAASCTPQRGMRLVTAPRADEPWCLTMVRRSWLTYQDGRNRPPGSRPRLPT